MAPSVAVYLEEGAKRTFAAALDWPGWCRQGPNETDALTALLVYAPRYASILAGPRLGFVAPKDLDQLVVVERLPGTPTTDFGAPSVAPTVDHQRSCDAAALRRFEKILVAGWRALDEAVESAHGKKLTTGPRGGGRSVDAIVRHVIGADAGYLAAVGLEGAEVRRRARAACSDPRSDPRGARGLGDWQDSVERSARRRPLDGTVLRPAGGVASPGAHVGDRAACRGPSRGCGRQARWDIGWCWLNDPGLLAL